jgi:hypothetical protein
MPVIRRTCGEQPLHPATEVSVGMRPEYEMEVVRHQTMPDDAHRSPFAGVGDQFQNARSSPSLWKTSARPEFLVLRPKPMCGPSFSMTPD